VFSSVVAERRSAIDTEITVTGFNFRNVNKDSISIGPGFTYEFSPDLAVTIAGFWQDVGFEDDPNSGLVDFRYWSGSVAAEYRINTSFLLHGRFDFSRFKAPDVNGGTDTYIAWLGTSGQVTRTLEIDVRAGVNFSQLEFESFDVVQVPGFGPILQQVPDSSDEVGYVLNSRIKKRFQLTTLEFEYSRNVSPSSRGAQSVTDEYTLRALRRINDRLSARGKVQFLDRNAEGQLDLGLDVKFLTAELLLIWEATDSLDVRGGYRFRHRSFRQQSADGHGLRLQLSYQFDPLRIF